MGSDGSDTRRMFLLLLLLLLLLLSALDYLLLCLRSLCIRSVFYLFLNLASSSASASASATACVSASAAVTTRELLLLLLPLAYKKCMQSDTAVQLFPPSVSECSLKATPAPRATGRQSAPELSVEVLATLLLLAA